MSAADKPEAPTPAQLRSWAANPVAGTPTVPLHQSTVRAIADELEALREDARRRDRVALIWSEVISNHCIAMQSALIEAWIGEGHEAGLQWIVNTLMGPGLLPDMDEAKALGGAQAWFDAKTAQEEARRAQLAAPDAARADEAAK